MTYTLSGLMTVGVLLGANSVAAHHSMSAVFDFNQRFTREGTLTKVDWRNPHIYLSVDAKGDQGQLEIWVFEGPSPVFFRPAPGGTTVSAVRIPMAVS